MNSSAAPAQRHSLRHFVLVGYVLLIMYASLSPFSGWQNQWFDFIDVLSAPVLQTYSAFDAILNCLSYMPLGLLLALTLRMRMGAVWSVVLATLGGILLSISMEYVQMFLPSRTSSNVDMLTNGLGTLVGATLAYIISPRAWFMRIVAWRDEYFQRGSGADFGLALVLLWMFAQINPSRLMLGNVFITEAAHRIFVSMPQEPFNIWESVAVAFNLLMVGLLLQTLLQVRRHAVTSLALMLCVVALIKFVAAAVLLKSWALLLWLNGEAMLGIVFGLALMWIGRNAQGRHLFWITLFAGLTYIVLALGVVDGGEPSSSLPLFQWPNGHLRTYNGLSQALSVMFPMLLGVYLILAQRRLKSNGVNE